MDDWAEKREYPRIEVDWTVTVLVDDEIIEGEAENISANGISICVEEPIPLNKVFQITINPPDHPTIQVSGKITWSELYGIDEEDKSIGMGVCFVEISENDQHFLDEFISDQLD